MVGFILSYKLCTSLRENDDDDEIYYYYYFLYFVKTGKSSSIDLKIKGRDEEN